MKLIGTTTELLPVIKSWRHISLSSLVIEYGLMIAYSRSGYVESGNTRSGDV